MCAYLFVSDYVCTMLDTLFYVSPVTVVIFLCLSKTLKLCKWHRAACALPLVSQVPVLIDTYIYEFHEEVVYISLLTILTMSTLLLIAAYKVFFK